METMVFKITQEDFDIAKTRASDRRHSWHNPMAVCIERTLGPGWACVVGFNLVHFNNIHGNQECRATIDDTLRKWLWMWRNGEAFPIEFTLTMRDGKSFQ